MWWEWVGLLIHLIFLNSLNDLYSSPRIPKGIDAECSLSEPPAKRLVFMVSSGTRADSLYRNETSPRPGPRGVATGSPPSRSFTGMAALTAGFRADPISDDIQTPLQYINHWDSFLNHSPKVIYIGCLSNFLYFKKTGSIHDWHYWFNPYCDLDYDKFEDTTTIDDKVADLLDDVLDYTLTDGDLADGLNGNRTVIFLQFSSVEKAGQMNGPHSELSKHTVKNLWSTVNRIVEEIENYFNDSSTAYILTSDRGQTDFGKSGGNSDAETTTPVSLWGAGVAKDSNQRVLRQEDVTSLAATLIGTPIPAHNLGVLPTSFLGVNVSSAAVALACNAFQLGSLAHKSTYTVPSFWQVITGSKTFSFQTYKHKIINSLNRNNFSETRHLCYELIDHAKSSLTNNESFFKTLILVAHLVLSAGWFLLLVTVMLPDESGRTREYSWLRIKVGLKGKTASAREFVNSLKKVSLKKQESNKTKTPMGDTQQKIVQNKIDEIVVETIQVENNSKKDGIVWRFYKLVCNLVLSSLLICVVFCTFLYDWQMHYLFYLIVPILVWWTVLYRVERFINFYNMELKFNWKTYLIYGAVGFIASEYLVWAMQKKLHIAFSIALLGFLPLYLKKKSWFHIVGYFISTTALCAITLCPSTERFINPWVIHTTQATGIIITFVFVKLVRVPYKDLWLTLSLISLQTVAECCVFANDLIINASSLTKNTTQETKIVTPVYMKIISWALLILGLTLPAAPYKKRLTVKLFLVVIGLSIPVILTTISNESLGLLILCLYLSFWLLLERAPEEDLVRYKSISRNDARRAIMLLLFLCFSHLVVGDFSATEQRMDVRSTRSFTDFDNDLQMIIVNSLRLLSVTMIPVAFFFRVCSFSEAEVEKIFPLTIIFTNIMALRVFFVTTDEIVKMDRHNAFMRNGFFHLLTIFSLSAFLVCRYLYRLTVMK